MEKNLNGKDLAAFVITKIGTPYVYGGKPNQGPLTQERLDYLAKTYPKYFYPSNYNIAKTSVGKIVTDCSGLPSWYTGIYYGSSQYYSNAKIRIPISKIKKFPIGTILWKSGHIGVYIGMENGIPMAVEAKGTRWGTVKSKVSDQPWKYGLIMKYIAYEGLDEIDKEETTSKGKNPYTTPTRNLKKGMIGNDVKWLQYELIEAGITKVKVNLKTKVLIMDGEFGEITFTALKQFQRSCKLEADGICGPKTIAALKADEGDQK